MMAGTRRGRDAFARFRPVIRAIVALLRFLPARAVLLLWSLANALGGTLGVGARYCLIKRLAAECGDTVYLGRDVEIRGFSQLRLGSNVSIHRTCYLDATGGLTIGNDVSIAHQTSILTAEHTWDDPRVPIRDNPVRLAPVVIHDDVWIGCGCRVLSGISLGPRAVVAAGAVVTRDVPSSTVVGGVPAKVLKSIAAASV